jgi:hypothetical protein
MTAREMQNKYQKLNQWLRDLYYPTPWESVVWFFRSTV